MFAPFAPDFADYVHISDVERLAIVLGIVVCATDFKGTAIGIADNLNASQWVSSMKAQHGVALQLLRTVSKWILKEECDSP